MGTHNVGYVGVPWVFVTPGVPGVSGFLGFLGSRKPYGQESPGTLQQIPQSPSFNSKVTNQICNGQFGIPIPE